MAREEMTFDNLDMSAFIPLESEVEETEIQEEEEEIAPPTPPVAEETIPEEVGTEEDDDDEAPSEEEQSQPSLYSSLAKVLQEEGVLPSLESGKEIKSVEDLVDAFRNEIKSNEFADLTEEQKTYLQAIRTGVPADHFVQQQSLISNLKTIQDDEISSNEELRKNIIYQDFLLKGYSPEKAEKFTQRSIDIGEDVDDAKEALQSLIQIQEGELQKQMQLAEQAKAQKAEEDKKQLLSFKKYLEDAKEFIPGVKMTQKVAEKVFEQATKPIAKAPNGIPLNAVQKARMENPLEFEAKLNYLFYLTKGFSDFTKIAVSQKTNAVKELDDFVRGNSFVPKGSGIGNNFDYTPEELKGGFDASIINNIT